MTLRVGRTPNSPPVSIYTIILLSLEIMRSLSKFFPLAYLPNQETHRGGAEDTEEEFKVKNLCELSVSVVNLPFPVFVAALPR